MPGPGVFFFVRASNSLGRREKIFPPTLDNWFGSLYLSGLGTNRLLLDPAKNDPNCTCYLPFAKESPPFSFSKSLFKLYLPGGGDWDFPGNADLLPYPNEVALETLVDGRS